MSERVADLARRLASVPAPLLVKLGVTPNAITISGVTLHCLLGAALAADLLDPLPAGALIVGLGLVDALDGVVARLGGTATRFGGFLDAVTDRVSDAAVLLGLLVRHEARGDRLEVLFLAAALATFPLVSYARARAELLGIACKGGVMTRSVRVLVLGLSVAIGLLLPAVAVMSVWAFFTALYRVLLVRRQIEGRDAPSKSSATP